MNALKKITLFSVGLTLSLNVVADKRLFYRDGSFVTLKVENEYPEFCDSMVIQANKKYRPIKVCLNAEDKQKIQVDQKVFEAITNRDWFSIPKSKKASQVFDGAALIQAQQNLAQITFKCFSEQSGPKARLVHKVGFGPRVDLELDCRIKDPKEVEKYMKQTVEYLKEISTPQGILKLSEEMGKQQTACLEGKVNSAECELLKRQWRKVLSGNISNNKLDPAIYCDLQVGTEQSGVMPYIAYLERDGRKCEAGGINCVTSDGKSVGFWKSLGEDGLEGFFNDNGERDGVWKMNCKEYGCDEINYKNGSKNGPAKENCTQYGCETGGYVNNLREGEWKLCLADYGTPDCPRGPYYNGMKHGSWIFPQKDGTNKTIKFKFDAEYFD